MCDTCLRVRSSSTILNYFAHTSSTDNYEAVYLSVCDKLAEFLKCFGSEINSVSRFRVSVASVVSGDQFCFEVSEKTFSIKIVFGKK